MVSFSSWGGRKMHAQDYLLNEVLKGELGFTGFLVSDWQAIDQIPGSYYEDVAISVNAGLDMIMVPYDYRTFVQTLTTAVENGDVPMSRIDDAVRRILGVKIALGLFENPYPDPTLLAQVGSAEHRALARQAVRQSLVLLKNEANTLPIAPDTPVIFVAGEAADDIGLQSGGWTIEWQGRPGNITPGTTILQGIEATVSTETTLHYNRFGNFDNLTDSSGSPLQADIGIAVISELPYAEGVGDRADLNLPADQIAMLDRMRQRSNHLVVILISGRPLLITEHLPQWDAFVAAWLPGSEGQGVADVLFGVHPFTGRLSYTWPRSMAQIPLDHATLSAGGCQGPLFPFGYGLVEGETVAPLEGCPAE
jgi:beta-glucosidase